MPINIQFCPPVSSVDILYRLSAYCRENPAYRGIGQAISGKFAAPSGKLSEPSGSVQELPQTLQNIPLHFQHTRQTFPHSLETFRNRPKPFRTLWKLSRTFRIVGGTCRKHSGRDLWLPHPCPTTIPLSIPTPSSQPQSIGENPWRIPSCPLKTPNS